MSTTEAPIITPSLAISNEAEILELGARLEREIDWYSSHERFATNADIVIAAKLGELAWVGVNENIVPVFRFRQPGNETRFPAFLLPNAATAYGVIGALWRSRLIEQGINDPGYRLASTSFSRSESVQAALVADPTKLASPNSTHCVGGPTDFDSSAYYWWSGDQGLMKVSDPRRDQAKATEIGALLGDTPPPPVAPVAYDERVTKALVSVLDELHEAGVVNHVLEFAGQPNQCSHVAPHPDFTGLSV